MQAIIGTTLFSKLSFILSTVLLLSAAIIDYKTRRVPNALTFPFILIGLILTAFINPYDYILKGVSLLLLFGIGAFNCVGLGDIKLLMALCLLWNPIYTFISYAIASVLIFVVDSIRHPENVLNNITASCSYLRRIHPIREKRDKKSTALAPYLFVAYILMQGGILLCQNF